MNLLEYLLSIALVFLPLGGMLFRVLPESAFVMLCGCNKVLPALKRRYMAIVVGMGM